LTRTYSNAIASLKELDIEVKGTKVNSGSNDVTVKTQMIGRAQPVAIDYSLINSAAGWKVYDVSVEGISLITAYRDEFNTLVSSSGVSGLIDVLKKKNGE
jgi:phospholipid transport system substrate-binding protein